MELITANQLRAARGLIGWSQHELAAESRVGRATIADFESGKRRPYPRTLADLQRSLESAGVEFVNGDDLGVKIKRGAAPAPRAAEAPAGQRVARSQPRPSAPEAEKKLYGRRATDRVETPISPEQVKIARELLGWSQAELAEKIGVSETAVGLFEREKRRLLALDVSAVRHALESAGVEFTNFDEPGARLKPEYSGMTLDAFLGELDSYEQHRLRPKGIMVANRGVKFGFALLYTERAAASLALEGKELGRVRWTGGTVEFDPPIEHSMGDRALENDLDQWASRAYARHLAAAA
jgi:transcriptional regulator with XRE-family HTH domain